MPQSTPAVSSSTPTPAARHNSLKFSRNEGFLTELRRRVDAYFEQTGHRRRDCPQMYFKTATILAWFAAAYLLLLFVATSWWTVIPLATVLGVAIAAIGFNIQHDGGHKSYSERSWINKIMAMTLDLMGGSSYIWDWKHNAIHHTFPNVDGHDDDIDVGILARLTPQQKRLWFHRLQCVYMWLLYGFLAIKWHFYDDFYNIATGRIGDHKITRPRGGDLLIFIGGKATFFLMAFGIPLLLHPWWAVLGVYILASFVSGIVLSVVFQLAHCVGEAEFPAPVPTPQGERMGTDWAVHQVLTTVNFSRRNPILCWFLGGLNFQIEHHLLHKICHVHYPALSKVVEETCKEFGIRYSAHRSIFSAIASHFRWLVQMGKPVT